jgi:hypothetical protein
VKIVEISMPEYVVQSKYSAKQLAALARKLDLSLVKYFNGRKIVLRAVSSERHSRTKVSLLKHIKTTGTDRYDLSQAGNGYLNKEGRLIDLFGRMVIVRPGKFLSLSLFKGFHWWVPKKGFQHKRMDIWLVYDRSKLKSVLYTHSKHNVQSRDGYVFKDPDNKPAALLGLITID